MRGRYYKSLAIMDSRRIIVLFVILKLVTVSAEPIRVDYSNCQLATYVENVLPNASIVTEQCCPPPPTRPIIDGVPPPLFSGIQVRQAYQCTDDIYRAKLERGYALMRALPDDDPRSFTKQYQVHCAYCAGAFSTDPRNGSTGIDIHFSWLFFPWHRFFLYFHERILQSLLGDPTFMLNYWNWDNPFTIGDGSSPAGSGVCNKAGFYFPNAYQDPTSSLYDDRRSDQAKGRGRFPFVDLSFNGQQTTAEQLPPNITAEDIILGNLNVMYTAMVSVGTTPVTFLGRPYRAGDLRGAPTATGGGGILEGTAHAAVHLWTGHDPPFILVDMGGISTSARDPVFFSHHSNIDRVFSLWRDIGPLIGAERSYFDDPDFLNAEFVFYDENLDLRRVHVRDALDTIPFGYVYQEAPLPWLNPNGTRNSCCPLSYNDTLGQAYNIPAPVKDVSGRYHLTAGIPLVIIVDRPASQGKEEFLTLSGIHLNRRNSGGFDIYVHLLDPTEYIMPTKCAEYAGRFTNMATSNYQNLRNTFLYKASLTKTLIDNNIPSDASKLVVTIFSLLPKGGREQTTIEDIYIGSD